MLKIPSLFCRNYDGDRLVRDEVVPGCKWVLEGEGHATRKWDGTACLIRNGELFKRYDMKAKRIAQGKKPPDMWEACEPEPDAVTGHWPGWVPIGEGPEDQYHREAIAHIPESLAFFRSRTFELCGPKINGNTERLNDHRLILHGSIIVQEFCGRQTFDEIKERLTAAAIEGIVWYHDDDGRMAKIKRRDFGIPWPESDGKAAVE